MQLQRQMLKLAINFLTTIILIPDARSQSEMECKLLDFNHLIGLQWARCY